MRSWLLEYAVVHNALPCLRSTVTRWTSGHCLGTFTAANFQLLCNKRSSCHFMINKLLNIRSLRNAVLATQLGAVGLVPLMQSHKLNWTLFRELSAELRRLNTCRQNNSIAKLPSGIIVTVLNPHGMAQTQPTRYGSGVSHGAVYEGRHILGCDVTYSKDGGSRFLRYVCFYLPDYTT